ncbi:MAG: paraquat-inducible protein A [Paracoccaceae bacterium]
MSAHPDVDAPTAREAGLVGCTSCGRVHALGTAECRRCGAALVSRRTGDLSRVWAWWVAGVIAYVPANVYPILYTRQLFQEEGATIVGGVVDLMHYGAYAVAFIIFFASVCIPVAKFVAVAWLALAVRRGARGDRHRLLHLYEVVEFVGRWSMIDVFVVAILAALVQFGALTSIAPGFAALAFALSVIFTMLAAQAFDPRRIWDRIGDAA